MFRLAFVLGLIIIGAFFALQGAFYALLFYLWNAYFRPDYWVWSSIVASLNLSWLIGIYVLGITLLSGQFGRLNARVGLLFIFLVLSLLSTLGSWNFDWS